MSTAAHSPIPSPNAWNAAQMRETGRWTYELSDTDRREVAAALAHVRAARLQIPFKAADFPLGAFGEKLGDIRREIEDGTGIVLIRGLDVDSYGLDGSRLAFWGIGAYIGAGLVQNPQAELMADVRDSGGADPDKVATTRGYNTSKELRFHNDQADVVGLLCFRTSKSGGASCVASAAAVHNEMLKTRPDLVDVLYGPFYADVRGEEPAGRKGFYEEPRFAIVNGRFYAQHGPTYIRSAQRFPEVPRLSAAQNEAMDTIDRLCADDRFRLDIDFRRGDIQFLNNHLVLHSRTGYIDFPQEELKRHLLRLWLTTAAYEPVPDFFRARRADMEYWRTHPTRVAQPA